MTDAEKFWPRIDTSDPSDCWPHRLAHTATATTSINGRRQRVHRWAMELHLGRPLNRAERVVADCRNPRCVNPQHLRIVDQAALQQLRVDRANANNKHSKIRNVYRDCDGK